MVLLGRSEELVLGVFRRWPGRAFRVRDIAREAGLGKVAAQSALYRLWRRGLVLRSREPLVEYRGEFRGRAGKIANTRSYYLYIAAPEGFDPKKKGELWFTVKVPGAPQRVCFVPYRAEYVDKRGKAIRGPSKAKKILEYLQAHAGEAFYSKDLAEALSLKARDIMANVRRFESKSLVIVRGYGSGERQTPSRRTPKRGLAEKPVRVLLLGSGLRFPHLGGAL